MLVKQNKILERIVNVWILFNDILVEIRRIDYFIFNAERCKNKSDIIKLTMFAMVSATNCTALISLLESELVELNTILKNG